MFAGVVELVIGATSNIRLGKVSKDPVFITMDGEPSIDEVTLSGFRNDNRYD
ncbi:MAG: hypothetical protein HPY52_12710 [Firmicutes bacterium]|nr:hypothetical protein [Bacillota bacterium]